MTTTATADKLAAIGRSTLSLIDPETGCFLPGTVWSLYYDLRDAIAAYDAEQAKTMTTAREEEGWVRVDQGNLPSDLTPYDDVWIEYEAKFDPHFWDQMNFATAYRRRPALATQGDRP